MKNIVRTTVVLFVLIFLCAGVIAYPAGVDMKEGHWETSSETSMTMEGMSMPPMANKSTYCLTREDPFRNRKRTRSAGSWTKGSRGTGFLAHGVQEGRGRRGNHLPRVRPTTGFFRMKMVEEGQTMTMNTKLAGKYLGPCPKGR